MATENIVLPETVKDSVLFYLYILDFNREKGTSPCQYQDLLRCIPQLDWCSWQFQYHPPKDAELIHPSKNETPVRMSIKFSQSVEGRVIVEADGLPTKTYDMPKSTYFDWDYLPYKDVYKATTFASLTNFKIIVEINVKPVNVTVQSDFGNDKENNIDSTDFEIHCENKQYKVHKDVLCKISPVFEAMLQHDFVEKSSSKLEITDFEFQTVETAMNIIYDRPTCFLSVKLMMSVLSFAGKYFITDLFDKLKKVLLNELSITNFDSVVRCVEDSANPELFYICARFFKWNEKNIKVTKGFLALPRPLVIKLYKIAYQFETELDAFLYMYQHEVDIDIKHMKVVTLDDFFKVFSFAVKHKYMELHNAVLSKFSPIFDALSKDNYAATSDNKFEIHDFEFKTVETALNTCYARPLGDISVELAVDVLRFVKKYNIMNVFESFEKLIERNLSNANFFDVLQCAHDCARKDLFAKCAKFYKTNEDALKNTEAFLALPGPLVAKLLKSAYNFETELDVFFYARDNGIHLDMEHIKVNTASDFFRSVPYAWHHHEENLKLKCAIFWRENKDILGVNPQYQQYPNSFKHSLDVLGLGNDDFINDDIDDVAVVHGMNGINFDDSDGSDDIDDIDDIYDDDDVDDIDDDDIF
uniref:BTB domain-containing protein n=1 Tax=Panagrellus redivivus TaxID=6233 RepID=A0A7E4W8X5_PANRE